MLQFIDAHRETLTASVCTGAMIFAATGLLDGKVATTKASYAEGEADPFEVFHERFPRVELNRAAIVDLGNQVTGGGVSLCIDTTLHMLAKLYDEETASKVAKVICYDVARAANLRERGIVTGSGDRQRPRLQIYRASNLQALKKRPLIRHTDPLFGIGGNTALGRDLRPLFRQPRIQFRVATETLRQAGARHDGEDGANHLA